jgi:hypothetical protein
MNVVASSGTTRCGDQPVRHLGLIRVGNYRSVPCCANGWSAVLSTTWQTKAFRPRIHEFDNYNVSGFDAMKGQVGCHVLEDIFDKN